MNAPKLLSPTAISLLTIVAAAGSAHAGVLTYEYSGFELFADEEANARYLEYLEAQDEDDPVDEEIFDAARSPTISGLTFTFSVDEASLPGGSVRGRSITEDDASLPRYVEYYERSGGFSLNVAFDAGGKVADWDIFGGEELEFISITSSGDSYGYDPVGYFGPNDLLVFSNDDPGRWERVSGDLAPIPTPAALPLALAGMGALALLSRRRGGRRAQG